MSKFKQFVSKTWVFGAAGAMILGGGAVTATALSGSAFAATVNGTVYGTDSGTSASAPQVSSSAGGYTLSTTPSQTPGPQSVTTGGGYTLSTKPNQTPGPQDLSAQQGAADAAALIKQAYGADLAGYTATPEFIKGAAPNTDQWVVEFSPPQNATSPDAYAASVNAVTGSMTAMGDTTVQEQWNSNVAPLNLSDPAWIASAAQDITKLLPAGVSITHSQVAWQKLGVVAVESQLSNGAAMGVLLASQDHNFPGGYQYWPNGYDGGWAGNN